VNELELNLVLWAVGCVGCDDGVACALIGLGCWSRGRGGGEG